MVGQLTELEIDELLHHEVVGRIGCHAEGRTYVVPITYAYDGHAIYAHSFDGMKIRMMRVNPNVSFEVDHMEDLGNWRCVIAAGRFEELHGADADHGMAILMARLLPFASTSDTSHPPKSLRHQHRIQVEDMPAISFRIVLAERTGRFERRELLGVSADG